MTRFTLLRQLGRGGMGVVWQARDEERDKDSRIGTFSRTGSISTGHVLYAATLLADGRVLIAGGDWVGSAELYR